MPESSPHLPALPLTAGWNTELVSVGIRQHHPVPVPAVGLFADFDAGHHLCPESCIGRTTWEQWLRRVRDGGQART
jgi:hypothetical protein